MVKLTKNTVDMTDMIVVNEDTRFFLSKPQPKRSELIPEFGQQIVLTKAVAVNDESIEVEPLQENLKAGSVLNFVDEDGVDLGSVTTSIPAKKKAKLIIINAAATAIANYAVAMSSSVEQVLTLANPVAKNDRVITLATPLVEWVEKGRVLSFPNGVDLVVKNRVEAGETDVSIHPASFAIPTGESVELENYLELCSFNQLDDSSSANTINERNNKSGLGTGKSVTSFNDTITISGNYIVGDFALTRLFAIKNDPLLRGNVAYALILEPEEGVNQFGRVHLGQKGSQRPNDQTKKISLTLEVDGLLEEVEVVRETLD